MKKLIVLTAALVLLSSSAYATIVGSSHDFSGAGYGSTEICIFCHTPHNATASSDAPLWNHELSTAGGYTMYTNAVSSSFDATPATSPSSNSLLCLSCHDGSVAIDSYGGATGSSNITGSALLSKDLSDDHPISIDYSNSGTGLRTEGTLSVTNGANTLPLFTTGTGTVECASCHDVHNAGTGASLLRISNANSTLCLVCHDK